MQEQITNTKKTKKILLTIAIAMLVVSIVLSVSLSLILSSQNTEVVEKTMIAEILNITEYKEGEKLLSDEVLNGNAVQMLSNKPGTSDQVVNQTRN